MKRYKYKNATIYIHGELDKHKVEEAAVIFIKKLYKRRGNKLKEKNQNGNKNTSRAV